MKKKKKTAKSTKAKTKTKIAVKSKAKSQNKKSLKATPKKSSPLKKLVKKAVKQVVRTVVESLDKKTTSKIENSPEDNSSKSTVTLGATVPSVTLEDMEGARVDVSDLAQSNRHLVLYFYPKDDTPGCTKQACEFRDTLSDLTQYGATVVGVSPDPKESHKNFIKKYDLNFKLLSDGEHALSQMMGVWKQKQFMGNSYMGVERSTFLYTDGKLTRVWQPVKVDGHVNEVVDAIKSA